jgi:hypothetical protein
MKGLSKTKLQKKRIHIYIFALLSVLLTGCILLFILVPPGYLDQKLYVRFKTYLEENFPVYFTANQFDFDVFGSTVKLRDIRIRHRSTPAEETQIKIDSIELNYSWISFLSPEVSLDFLEISRPIVRASNQEDGRLDIASMFSRIDKEEGPKNGQSSAFRINIGKVAIEDASISYRDSSRQLNLSGDGFQASFGGSGDHNLSGDLYIEQFELNSGDFQLSPSQLEFKWQYEKPFFIVQSASLDSDQFKVFLTGTIETESNPQVTNLDFELTLKQSPQSIFKFHNEGNLNATGKIRGDIENFQIDGKTESELMVLDGYRLSSLALEFQANKESIQIKNGQTEFCSGTVNFDGMIGLQDDSLSKIEIETSSLQASKCVEEFDKHSPFEALIDSSLSMNWPGLQIDRFRIEGKADLKGFFRKSPENKDLVLRGGSLFSFGRGILRFQDLDIQNRQIRLMGDGQFEPGSDKFGLFGSIDTDNAQAVLDILDDLQLVSPEFFQQYKVKPSGNLTANVEIDISPQDRIFKTELRLEKTEWNKIQMGTMDGKILWKKDLILIDQLVWSRNRQSLKAGLEWNFDNENLFLKRVDLETNDLPAQTISFLFTDDTLRGSISGNYKSHKDNFLASPKGSGRVRLKNLEWRDEEINLIDTSFFLEGNRVSLQDLQSSILSGNLAGHFEIDFDRHFFRTDLRAKGISLEEINHLQQTVSISGLVDLELNGSGNWRNPKFDLRMISPNITVNNDRFNQFNLTSFSDGSQVSVGLNAQFLDDPFQIDGRIGISEPFPFSTRLLVNNLSILDYLDYFAPDQPITKGFSGEITGKVEAEGNLYPFELASLQADLSDLQLSIHDSELRLRKADSLVLEEKLIRLSNLELEGENTELSIDGTVGIDDSNQLDLKLFGKMDLDLLSGFLDDGAVQGYINVDTRLAGSLKEPTIVGNADLISVSLVHPSIPVEILEANGSLAFTTNQIAVEDVVLATKHGEVYLEGGIFLRGMDPYRWQLNAVGSGLNMEFPEDVRNTLDIDLDLIRTEYSQLISGAVYLRSAIYDQRITLPELILQLTRQAPSTPASALEQPVILDIEVEAYRTLRIQNNLADITASGDFKITGNLRKPVILGSVNVDRGQIIFGSNTYDVDRGSVTFIDPNETTPYFNFEISTDVRDYTVGVLLRGSIDQPRLTLRSDPPLPTGSIISLIASGQANEQLFGRASTDTGTLATYGATALLGKTVEQAVSSQTNNIFGFEKFSIDPFITNSSGRNPGARVTLGKQITQDLNVTFMTSLGGEFTTQVVVVQYRLAPWLTTVGTREEDGSISLDFKFKKRF